MVNRKNLIINLNIVKINSKVLDPRPMVEEDIFEAEGIDPGLQRAPTVLVLDTSGSMEKAVADSSGEKRPRIDQLNRGLEIFKEEISNMTEVKDEVDVALVTFGGGVSVKQEFTPITEWEPPTLTEGGRTPMGEAIRKAFELINDRKEEYTDNGLAYNRPFIWVLTDGIPTDIEPGTEEWSNLREDIEDGEEHNHFALFLMTVGEDAETEVMRQLHPERTLPLKDGKFEEYFEFLSNSMEQVSSTEVDEDPDISEQAKEFEDMFQI